MKPKPDSDFADAVKALASYKPAKRQTAPDNPPKKAEMTKRYRLAKSR